ncbi:MAG: hypothetical protein Q8P27_02835 [Candidatus Peregrinibacteria bacterium]|nr:hypothetical protein [Candidatus Peregrinibacteria bacterium]
MKEAKVKIIKQRLLALLRLSLGWTFFWGFIDKVWGLGFATLPEDAWLAGGSPTYGFLAFATKGPLAGFYQGMAGSPVVDWLFMMGLLLLGVSLLLGIGLRLASYGGPLLMLLLWSAALPPEHNPFMDEHIIYALLLFGMPYSNAGDYWGLGQWWAKQSLVKKFPILK